MAVKRNISVSSTISRLDRRIHGVESRAIALSGASGIVTTTAADDQDPNGAPGASLELPPYTYRPVTKAYIYGGKVTGNTPRLELYFSEDPEIVAGDTVRLQGLHGTSTDNFELSPKSFRVFATDTPPWTNDVRATQPWRNTPTEGNNGETVEYTVWFNPVVEVPNSYPSNAGRELITTRRIDSISATGSTVTVTFNSTHLFEVGDVVYIDSISIQTLLFGVDGLFKVSEVVSNTVIKYELSSPLQIPLSLTSAQIGTKYVYPVAQRFVEEGTIWIDKGVEPNRVYVWKEYRWYDTADPIGTVTAQQDGIAPSPVTNLELDSEVPVGDTSPNIILTWTPPTTRSNGASISGFFSGYEIWYKRSTDATWKTEFVRDTAGTVTTHTLKDPSIVQNRTYNIRVYVVDIMSQVSTAASDSILTATFSEVLNPPSKPLVSSRLGTIKITWDGDDSTGNLPVLGVLYIEFHASNTSGFTPSDATLVGTAPSVIDGNYVVLSDLTYGANYFFKTIFVRRLSPVELDKSLPSLQSDAIQVAQLVNTDLIANTISGAAIQSGTITASDKIIGNTITGALIQALAIDTGQLKANAITADKIEGGAISGVVIRGDVIKTANTGSRVELSNTGIYAYDGNTPVFSFNTSTASLTIGGYATTSALTGVSTTASNALTTAEGRLAPGSAAADVNANYLTTTIRGDAITTGTIDASRITVTDTFRYTSSLGASPAYEVKLGASAIASLSGTSSGLGFFQGGTQYGYLATWGAGRFELGADFGSAYITIGLNNTYGLQSNFANGYDLFGTTIRSYAAVVVERPSTSAFQVRGSNIAGDRVISVDTTTSKLIVGNGDIANTVNTLDVFGRIRATGTITANTSVSSIRYKTDVREFNTPIEILDITPKTYKYDNHVLYETWPDSYANSLPKYSQEHVGAIAEDFIAIGLDYLVSRDEEGRPEALDYSKISVLLIPYIKDLYNQVEEIKKEIQ